MDDKLLQKYFKNQCTPEEVEKVLDWLSTPEGIEYLENKLDEDVEQFADEDMLFLIQDVPSDEMYKTIQTRNLNQAEIKRPGSWFMRFAAVLLLCASVAGAGYLWMPSFGVAEETAQTEPLYRLIKTESNEQRLITLSDGTKVRMNANSQLKLPEVFSDSLRNIELQGEAYFEVAHDQNRPFIIDADDARVRVLGTKFNVKVDSLSQKVQVAVVGGKVSLKNKNDHAEGSGAILIKDNFGIYDLNTGDILIEKTPVENYLSWINGRLVFFETSLEEVSHYLERLYDVRIQFKNNDIKDLSYSIDMEKRDLKSVLDVIAQTLDVNYVHEGSTVTWKKN